MRLTPELQKSTSVLARAATTRWLSTSPTMALRFLKNAATAFRAVLHHEAERIGHRTCRGSACAVAPRRRHLSHSAHRRSIHQDVPNVAPVESGHVTDGIFQHQFATNSAISSLVNWKRKRSGNLSIFRFTA